MSGGLATGRGNRRVSRANLASITAEQRRARFERLSNVREVVFGMQDGILTTAGVLCGAGRGAAPPLRSILTALASTAAGAISMGAGLSRDAGRRQVLEGELNRARGEVVGGPYLVQENLLEQLSKEGLSREAGDRVVKLLSSAPEALTKTAEQKINGIGDNPGLQPDYRRRRDGDGFRNRGAGAAVALCLVSSTNTGLVGAVVATAAALFAVGYFEGWLADRTRWFERYPLSINRAGCGGGRFRTGN